jgi:sialate O-acetylesterase
MIRVSRWFACVLVAGAVQADEPLFAAIFSDHMVLQRDRPIDVFGRATPGEQVTVSMAGAARTTHADASGAWALELPTLHAGGPHALVATAGGRRQAVSDVLVGDVWLCSGQSNMEFTVRHALNADWEAQHSANNTIRHVAIAHATSPKPLAEFAAPLVWKVAGPSTVGDFSAVCYYFARELQKSTNVPQGLIHSSWGGTRIEQWLSREALTALGDDKAKLELLDLYARDRNAAIAVYAQQWQQWWTSQPAVHGSQPWGAAKQSGEWKAAPAGLGSWELWGDSALSNFDGVVWYRAHAKVSGAQARQAATLELGPVTDVDMAWVNGKPVGSGFGAEARVYALPAKALASGDNAIVIGDFNMWGQGGIAGPANKLLVRFADGSTAPLTGIEYQAAPEGLTKFVRSPWDSIEGVTVLYNAMIAPLRNFGLRGAAWYQGESNTGPESAPGYEALLRALFSDWRRQFQAPLSFFVVQLADFGQIATAPIDSGWARVRDAQRRAVTVDGNAGLAVTIDIGNRDDIHPTNKQDVGKRLAHAARRVAFGEQISASGGAPKSATRSVTGVDVTLSDFDGALRVDGSKDPSAFELCGDTQASCHFVRASLGEGGVVHLEDAAPGAATRVRYCWADAPICNLYDTTGLPVGPFEQEIE